MYTIAHNQSENHSSAITRDTGARDK